MGVYTFPSADQLDYWHIPSSLEKYLRILDKDSRMFKDAKLEAVKEICCAVTHKHGDGFDIPAIWIPVCTRLCTNFFIPVTRNILSYIRKYLEMGALPLASFQHFFLDVPGKNTIQIPCNGPTIIIKISDQLTTTELQKLWKSMKEANIEMQKKSKNAIKYNVKAAYHVGRTLDIDVALLLHRFKLEGKSWHDMLLEISRMRESGTWPTKLISRNATASDLQRRYRKIRGIIKRMGQDGIVGGDLAYNIVQ